MQGPLLFTLLVLIRRMGCCKELPLRRHPSLYIAPSCGWMQTPESTRNKMDFTNKPASRHCRRSIYTDKSDFITPSLSGQQHRLHSIILSCVLKYSPLYPPLQY
ncbi:hypothetical protein F5X97DRAFT_306383 [Nemania serpens]|nr:hypothetical protein F5X97DRAFT_306383 [Nemania serpens]